MGDIPEGIEAADRAGHPELHDSHRARFVGEPEDLVDALAL